MTRADVFRRLEHMEREITELKTALMEQWPEAEDHDATQVFLDKCGGWEDSRTPEEIVNDIYESRTTSERGAETC